MPGGNTGEHIIEVSAEVMKFNNSIQTDRRTIWTYMLFCVHMLVIGLDIVRYNYSDC